MSQTGVIWEAKNALARFSKQFTDSVVLYKGQRPEARFNSRVSAILKRAYSPHRFKMHFPGALPQSEMKPRPWR